MANPVGGLVGIYANEPSALTTPNGMVECFGISVDFGRIKCTKLYVTDPFQARFDPYMARGECFGVTDDLAILYRTDLRTSYVSTYQ